jgi:protein CMS1
MGGDDLGSEDEYLIDSDIGEADIHEASDDDSSVNGVDQKADTKKDKKRKHEGAKEDSDVLLEGEVSSKKKKGKSKRDKSDKEDLTDIDTSHSAGRQKLMLHASRGIGKEMPEVQASFLWTCYSHALLGSAEASDLSQLGPKFESSAFVNWWEKIKQSDNLQHLKMLKAADGELSNNVRDALLPSIVKESVSSMKKLKKWSNKQSPMVLVVCVSARRCVAVLKTLTALKVKCGKLFAKHMDYGEQLKMLKSTSFPIAVGTPNRLLKLCQEKNGLTLKHTDVVIVDGYENDKAFTVCTLKDTAPDLAQLLRDEVQPQLQKTSSGKPFKIVMS